LVDLADKIQDLRKQSGLTQNDFAKKLHVTRQAVTRWETGETTPTLDTLKAMMTAFKLDANKLFDNEYFCQSCHMMLSKTEDFGTNADSSLNTEYCSHCFVGGAFEDYTTVEEAIADSVNYAEYAGMTKEQMLSYATENYPKLKKWAK